MMIDEMAVLGRMGPLAKAFHEASGRNLSIWGFTQNLNDITELYGKEEAANILSSAQAIQFFNVARIDNQTCEYISQAIGDTTVLTESRSDSKGSSNTQHTYFANSSQNAAVSYTETSRRLLKPEEVARLDDDAMVVFVRNSRFKTDPILCYKPKYYLRAEWQGCFQ